MSGDLANFKSGPINAKIALWDPQTNGVRYVKALIHNHCVALSDENRRRMSSIKNREVGNPITVRFNGEEICLDYLQAVYELEFIEQHFQSADAKVLEIGAGYGRTCHAIMSNCDVQSYHIVDLEHCLSLGQWYLKEVLDAHSFSKISFVSAEDIECLRELPFDLCINIDSMAEMDAEVVHYYLDFVGNQCGHFYVKNPVGKYLDKSLDGHHQGEEGVQLALSTGLLRDVIDIHDNVAVRAQAGKFVEAYRPGSQWECLADSWAPPWSYYWQAIYLNPNFNRE